MILTKWNRDLNSLGGISELSNPDHWSQKSRFRDFPGGPVVGDSVLPMQGTWVAFWLGNLRTHMHGMAKRLKKVDSLAYLFNTLLDNYCSLSHQIIGLLHLGWKGPKVSSFCHMSFRDRLPLSKYNQSKHGNNASFIQAKEMLTCLHITSAGMGHWTLNFQILLASAQ